MVTRQDGTTTIPDWQLGLAATILIAATGAVGTWVGTTLNDYGHRINGHDTTLATHTQQLKQVEIQVDKIDIKLGRMDEKIDKVLEELRNK